jgi:hypothetical protein
MVDVSREFFLFQYDVSMIRCIIHTVYHMSTVVVEPMDVPEARHIVDQGGLTYKQRMFCEKLMADPDFNPNKAAKAAGYASPNSTVSQLMKDPKILRFMGSLIHKRSEALHVDARRVLRELASIGLFNVQSLFSKDGERDLIDVRDLPEEVACAIKSTKIIKDKDGTIIRVEACELWNKMQALEALAKHVGILKELAAVNVNVAFDWDGLLGVLHKAAGDTVEQRIQQKLLEAKSGSTLQPTTGTESTTVQRPATDSDEGDRTVQGDDKG